MKTQLVMKQQPTTDLQELLTANRSFGFHAANNSNCEVHGIKVDNL